VRKRVSDLTVSEIKRRNAEYDQQQILELIDQEVECRPLGITVPYNANFDCKKAILRHENRLLWQIFSGL